MSNVIEVSGTLFKKNHPKTVSEKLTIQDFVIKTDGKYVQYIQLQVKNDIMVHLEKVNIGDAIKVSFNLDGRLWTGSDGIEKCFNTLSAWKIEKVGESEKPTHVPDKPSDDSSGLPF